MTLQLAFAFVKGQCGYNKRVSQAETWPSSLFALTFGVVSSGQLRWLRCRRCHCRRRASVNGRRQYCIITRGTKVVVPFRSIPSFYLRSSRPLCLAQLGGLPDLACAQARTIGLIRSTGTRTRGQTPAAVVQPAQEEECGMLTFISPPIRCHFSPNSQKSPFSVCPPVCPPLPPYTSRTPFSSYSQ